jgi:hypothetical protein
MVKYIGKICLCAFSTVFGTMLGGVLSRALHLEQPKLPVPLNPQLLGILCLVGGFMLSFFLTMWLPQLPVNRRTRFIVIAWFVFAWMGINNTIEALIFTTIGGGPTIITTMLLQSIFVSGAVALLFGPRQRGESFSGAVRRLFDSRTAAQWTVCLLLMVLAFPVVYFFFGMPVGLMFAKVYQQQSFNLQLPTLNVLIGVQFIRSLIALLAVLPVLAIWAGSRQRFAWMFGLNLFVVAGLYGLIQAYWMPWALRSVHLVELFLDSMVYAWLVAVLLLPRAPTRVVEVGAPNYTI